MREDKFQNIKTVLIHLRDHPDGTHLRRISRECKLGIATVNRVLKELSDFIEVRDFKQEDIALPNMPRLIYFKSGYTAKGVWEVCKIKQKLGK